VSYLGDKFYKPGHISEYPFTDKQAYHINSLAEKQIKSNCNRLHRRGMRILMALEIEVDLGFEARRNLPQLIINEIGLSSSPVKIAQYLGQDLELRFPKQRPISFLRIINKLKTTLKRVAAKKNVSFSFFNVGDEFGYPSFHINFSLWKNKKNIFGLYQQYPRIINFIMNRLIEDIKETAFIFALGKYSLKRIDDLRYSDKYLSFISVLQSDNRSFKNYSPMALPLRDFDNPNTARVEVRRFNDNTGIQSLKVLMIVKSIADSLDQIIKLPGVKSFDDLEEVNSKLADKPEAQLVDNTRNNDYKLSSIFPEGDEWESGHEVLRDRFKKSQRAKEIFGDELHARICEADFTLVG